jgi:DNA-binding NarL/FixJ family response regulator
MEQPLKLLIVDDEDLIRERFRQTFPFEAYGFRVVGEAGDGEQALALCRALQPDIVLTDIVMPVMDGISLIRRLGEEFPRIQSIILSCHDEFALARQAVSIGAVDYLLKMDTRFEDLLQVLERARQNLLSLRGQEHPPFEQREELIAELLRQREEYPGRRTELMRRMGAAPEAECFSLGLRSMPGYYRFSDAAENGRALQQAILQLLDQGFEGQGKVYSFSWKLTRIGVCSIGNSPPLSVTNFQIIWRFGIFVPEIREELRSAPARREHPSGRCTGGGFSAALQSAMEGGDGSAAGAFYHPGESVCLFERQQSCSPLSPCCKTP